MALDRDQMNEILSDGLPDRRRTVRSRRATIGYLDDPGFPDHDLPEAKRLVAEYEADGGDASSCHLIIDPGSAGSRTASCPGAAVQDGRHLGAGRPRGAGQADQRARSPASSRRSSSAQPPRRATPTRSTSGGTPGSPVELRPHRRPRDRPAARRRPGRGRPGRAHEDLRGPQPAVRRRRCGTSWLSFAPGPSPRRPTSTASSGPDLPDGSKPSGSVSTAHSLLGVWIAA